MNVKFILPIKRQFLAAVGLNFFNWEVIYRKEMELLFLSAWFKTLLLELVKGRMHPNQEILEKCCDESDGFETQQLLLQETILQPLNVNHSVRKSYQKTFLKYIIDFLESKEAEIADDLYEEYVKCVNSEQSGNIHLHFLDEEGEILVSISETLSFISNGTTGLSTWPASRILAEYCVKNSAEFHGKNILELGCGTGLLGLTVVKSCQPKRVIFSDCHEEVLKLVSSNIRLSCGEVQSNEPNGNWFLKTTHKSTEIEVRKLPWEEINAETFEELPIDVIIGTDLIYDTSVRHDLVKSLKFASSSSSVNILLAVAVRNSETFQKFSETVVEHKGVIQDVPFEPHGLFYPYGDVPLKIFRVSFVSV